MRKHVKIVVGIDGSDHSMKALNEAILIAKKFDGTIITITVYTKENQANLEKIKLAADTMICDEASNYVFHSILGSNPSRAIIDMAIKENADLVVVGSRGLGKAASFILGSVSKDVVTNASCSVLVVK